MTSSSIREIHPDLEGTFPLIGEVDFFFVDELQLDKLIFEGANTFS